MAVPTYDLMMRPLTAWNAQCHDFRGQLEMVVHRGLGTTPRPVLAGGKLQQRMETVLTNDDVLREIRQTARAETTGVALVSGTTSVRTEW